MCCETPPCDIPDEFFRFHHPLAKLERSLKGQGNIRIVAIGSSSTAGEGGIVPYPARVEMKLRELFHGRTVDVVNRGIGGQEARDELNRFDPDVFGEAPVLVIWQVGANAIFRQQDFKLSDVVAAIAEGLDRLREQAIDVVLMDPQYGPAMLQPTTTGLAETVVSLIAAEAEKAGVNVFRRFALMKHWRWDKGILFNRMIDPTDNTQLHQSDWSTNCVAQALARAIADKATGVV